MLRHKRWKKQLILHSFSIWNNANDIKYRNFDRRVFGSLDSRRAGA